MRLRHEHEGEAPRASCHVYCIKHEDFSCYNYVFYITTTPYLLCNNNNRKELYDTAITLTTRYKCCKRSAVSVYVSVTSGNAWSHRDYDYVPCMIVINISSCSCAVLWPTKICSRCSYYLWVSCLLCCDSFQFRKYCTWRLFHSALFAC